MSRAHRPRLSPWLRLATPLALMALVGGPFTIGFCDLEEGFLGGVFFLTVDLLGVGCFCFCTLLASTLVLGESVTLMTSMGLSGVLEIPYFDIKVSESTACRRRFSSTAATSITSRALRSVSVTLR